MVELTCVSCGAKETVTNSVEEKRSRTCVRCGQTLIEQRRPGSSPVQAQA